MSQKELHISLSNQHLVLIENICKVVILREKQGSMGEGMTYQDSWVVGTWVYALKEEWTCT